MEFAKQLIHWFTSNQQKENPDTMALLDAILDGLVDPENGSLRSYNLSLLSPETFRIFLYNGYPSLLSPRSTGVIVPLYHGIVQEVVALRCLVHSKQLCTSVLIGWDSLGLWDFCRSDHGSLVCYCREFCADCFSEFMRWSVRHAPPEVSCFFCLRTINDTWRHLRDCWEIVQRA